MKFKKNIFIVIFFVILILFLYPEHEMHQNITFPVTKGDVQRTVSASGILQASEQVDIGAQVSGQIKNIPVKEGQYVKKGDLLAVIDPQLAETELKLAKAELENAQAGLDSKSAIFRQYQADLIRYTKLIKKKAITEQTLEEAQMRFDIAKAEIKMAKSNVDAAVIRVDKAQTQLGYTEIRSPMDAVVISIIAKSGQTLATLQQVPVLMKLADIDTMQVNAKISEADVVHIHAGAPVSFTLLGEPNNRFSAQLDSVKLAPTHINEQSDNNISSSNAIYYYATFKVPNPEHKLRIAMTATVTIFLDKREDVLTIPLSALGKMVTPNQYQVNVLDSTGEKRQTTIKIGLKDDVKVEVIEGLTLQDNVILPEEKLLTQSDEDIYNIL